MKRSAVSLLLLFAGLVTGLQGCSTPAGQRLARQEPRSPQPPVQAADSRIATDTIVNVADDESDGIAPVAFVEPTPADTTSDAAGTPDPPNPLNMPQPVDFPADADQPLEGMTLESLESLALQNNPSIPQVSAAASRAAGIRAQVGLKPNPTIGYFGEEIGNEGAGGLNGAFVSQTFVRGDKLAWNRDVIGHDVDALMWQVDVQRQRVRTDVRIQFYEALVAQNRLQLAREFRDVAEKGVRISEDRLRIMVGARPDVLQSEIQLGEVDLLIQRAELEFQAAWNELAATTGLPNLGVTQLIGTLSASTEERHADAVYQQIVAVSPLLASANARVNRARANLRRQQLQPIPNVTAQLGAGHDDATGDEFANVQLSLPLPLHNKNQGNIRAAHAEYCEATQNVERLKLQIRRDLARVMREYQVALATVRQYESTILPKAQESLSLIQEAEQAGQFDFLRVLTARRMFFDVNLQYVRALGDLAQANARLDGLLLTGSLENVSSYDTGDDLRGQALNGR